MGARGVRGVLAELRLDAQECCVVLLECNAMTVAGRLARSSVAPQPMLWNSHESQTRMNLPNQLSLGRLILTLPFVAITYLPVPVSNRASWALLIFMVASLTDYLDGEIARRRGLVTNFGKLFDPVADKILMAAALTMLAVNGAIPAWIIIAILAREFFVSGIRQIAASQGVVLAAERLGKHKMLWQVFTVIYFLGELAAKEPMLAFVKPIYGWGPTSPKVLGQFTIYFTALLTLVSGFSYFWKNRKLFADA
jgi:CDP-diacylglycerol--glycerol-3-phosphate 3-phosphatidyltransferase